MNTTLTIGAADAVYYALAERFGEAGPSLTTEQVVLLAHIVHDHGGQRLDEVAAVVEGFVSSLEPLSARERATVVDILVILVKGRA